jgi:hypothetical protein
MALVNSYHLGDCRALIDAEIRVTGICLREPDAQQRLTRVELLVAGMGDIAVLRPAPADPFGVPACSIALLSQAGFSLLHRVRISGTVSLHQPGQVFYLETESGGLRVESRQLTALRSGDLVEVLGFASHASNAFPVLEHAEFRKIGARTNFVPFRASPGDLEDPACLGRWVEVDAYAAGPGRPTQLRVGGVCVRISFLSGAQAQPLPANTPVRVKGVLVQGRQGNFELAVRSASDIERLRRASRSGPWVLAAVLLIAVILATSLWRRKRNLGRRSGEIGKRSFDR